MKMKIMECRFYIKCNFEKFFEVKLDKLRFCYKKKKPSIDATKVVAMEVNN